MRRTLLFLLPMLSLGAEGPRFIAGSEWIRIDKDGWSALDGSGLHFRGMSRSAAFDSAKPVARVSQFIGGDPRRWIHGASSYVRIREANVYPKIDVVYYPRDRALEYDFVVRPGGHVRRIIMNWNAPGDPRLDPDGSLSVTGQIRLAAPRAYQISSGKRFAVSCRYVAHGRLITLDVGHYDHSQALIIDPQLVYAHLGGGTPLAIASDQDGNDYFATNPGPNVFMITKRDPSGNMLWTSQLGSLQLFPILSTTLSLVVDRSYNVYLAGAAYPSAFPATMNAFPNQADPRSRVSALYRN